MLILIEISSEMRNTFESNGTTHYTPAILCVRRTKEGMARSFVHVIKLKFISTEVIHQTLYKTHRNKQWANSVGVHRKKQKRHFHDIAKVSN